MVSHRALLLLALLVAFGASAQDAAEFGRAVGREVVLTPKGAAPFSGTLSLSVATRNDVFGRGTSPSYGITAGGSLIQDRLWFFASGSRQSGSRYGELQLPQNATTGAVGGRVNAQLTASQDFSGFFESARRREPGFVAPSSFLSMRYTGIISSSMFFNARFVRSR